MEIRRVCKWCGSSFDLTEKQMRQTKSKWPTHCSRSCAKRTQHARSHADKREEKICPICGVTFQVANWDRGKIYCSNKCASRARFGDPTVTIKKTRAKVEAITRDEKYMIFLKRIARNLGIKYAVDWEDIFQDYILDLLEAHNSFMHQRAMETVRKEYNRGITGKRKAKNLLSAIEYLPHRAVVTSPNFQEFAFDLKRLLTGDELKLTELLFFSDFTPTDIARNMKIRRGVAHERVNKVKDKIVKFIIE